MSSSTTWIAQPVALPTEHQQFLNAALVVLESDTRIVGVAAAGSYRTNTVDAYSDVDLVIAVEPQYYDDVLTQRQEIAARLGPPLLAAFTGEHVGEPRLLICLYGSPLLHVDLKFVSLSDIAHRVEDYVVLFERNGQVTAALATEKAVFPEPDLQWTEDRFWVWVHYGAAKIGRGEWFEAIGFLAFLREQVLGPLLLMRHGYLPRGVRRVENEAAPDLPALLLTLADHDALSCADALLYAADLYSMLREHFATPTLVRRTEAEQASRQYLTDIITSLRVLPFSGPKGE